MKSSHKTSTEGTGMFKAVNLGLAGQQNQRRNWEPACLPMQHNQDTGECWELETCVSFSTSYRQLAAATFPSCCSCMPCLSTSALGLTYARLLQPAGQQGPGPAQTCCSLGILVASASAERSSSAAVTPEQAQAAPPPVRIQLYQRPQQ